MGCDIHVFAQRRTPQGWKTIPALAPLDRRSYGMFGFLADVRNYSAVPPISPARGLPDDLARDAEEYEELEYCHSCSWLSVDELFAFDYDQPFEDRRTTRQTAPNVWNSGMTCEPGEGEPTTFRVFLGDAFFDDLAELRLAGADRIVFGFDS